MPCLDCVGWNRTLPKNTPKRSTAESLCTEGRPPRVRSCANRCIFGDKSKYNYKARPDAIGHCSAFIAAKADPRRLREAGYAARAVGLSRALLLFGMAGHQGTL